MKKKRLKAHLVVAGASEFGQYACARVLHRAYAHVTKVTLIVARKDEQLFHKRRPAAAEWSRFSSLYECLEKLKSEGRPINYVFDDHIQYLAAELLKEGGDYDRLGYVATRGEEHLPYTTILSACCDRVLVEKPLSKCGEDVHPHGLFMKLEKKRKRWSKEYPTDQTITTCEHFTFRKGFSDAKERLVDFVANHWNHGKLKYEFRFFEPAKAGSLVSRLSAMQDGSILDVAVTHGLGPLSFILRERPDICNSFDLHDCITWDQVLVKQAREQANPNAPLTVPVLAETAAYLEGTFEHKDAPLIHLKIESGKGGTSPERYFRFVCEECNTPKEKCFFGVSLGLAGYTKYDWKGKKNKEPEAYDFDGGWESDKFGDTQIPAENAQASMLEHFIIGDDNRFIPLNQACQVVRLGIEAQALGFCQNRLPYRLDQSLDNWPNLRQNESVDNCNEGHHNLKQVWKIENALERLKMAIGVENEKLSQKPCFRVLTIFGPVGVGNTDISERLQEKLNKELKKRESDMDVVHLVKIPRDKKWCKEKGSSDYSVERVILELGKKLKIVTDVSADATSDLCNRVRECAQLLNPCILIINGIDRLGSEAYSQLIRLLNELSPCIRIIMVTNKGEQTCGWVIRSEELIPYLLGDIKDIPARHRENFANFLRTISSFITEKMIEEIENKIDELAKHNITLYQQLCSYLRYIILPQLYKKNRHLSPENLKSIVDRELAAISLPSTITPNPERMLKRIGSACIGAINSSDDLRLIRALAEVPDLIPEEFLDSLQHGLSQRMEIQGKGGNIDTLDTPLYSLFEHTSQWYRTDDESDRGTFAIFPQIRHIASNYNEEQIQEVCADIDRQKMILSVYLEAGGVFTDLFLELLFNLAEESPYEFGRLDLGSGTLFEIRCEKICKVLERDSMGRPDSRLHKFLTSLLQQKTNLGIKTRAKMIALEAWRHLLSATTWESIKSLMERIADACNIIERFTPFSEAFKDPFCRFPLKKTLKKDKPDILMMRYLLSAKIALERVWDWLYAVDIPSATSLSPKLKEKLELAEKELTEYTKQNLEKKSEVKDKELLAVILREISLLSAYRNSGNITNDLFKDEINQLNTAYNLLETLIVRDSNEIQKGLFIRIGFNQSVIALLYYHRAKQLCDNAEQEESLNLAKRKLEDVEKLYNKHKFKLSGCPFLLLAQARIQGKKKEKLEEAKSNFQRTGRDFFCNIAKKMEKEVSEDKGTS